MTRYILIILSAFIIISASAQNTFYSTNYNSAISKAKKNKKYVLVYFTESENSLDEENIYEPLLSNNEVEESAKSSYNVVLISKNNSKYATLKNKYKVSYFPTYLFIDYNQYLVHKRIGVLKTEEVNTLLENVTENENTLRYFKRIEKKSPQKLNNLNYANALYEAGMSYDKYIKAYFASIDESDYDLPQNIDAFYRFVNDIYSNEFNYFVQIKDFPEENISFTQQDYKFRVEDVITNHLIAVFDENKQVSFEDTFNSVTEYFNIEDVTGLSSNILVYYYKNINIDNNQYLSILPIYISTHKDIISNEEMSNYCSELVESKDIEALNNAHLWIQEVLIEIPSIENYFTDFKLLIKLDKVTEANDILRIVESKGNDIFTKEWRNKFNDLLNSEPIKR